MRIRALLATLVLSLTIAGASLPAQEIRQSQIADWPAPAFWTPPASAGPARVSGDRARLAPAAAISSALTFVAVAPCRMLDTRTTTPIASGSTRDITLTGAPCGIPSNAAAVSANFVVFNITGSGSNGVLTVYPTGSPSTSMALINWSPISGQIDNAAVVPVGSGGAVTVQPNQGAGTIDMVIDVNGYYGGGVVTTLNALSGDVTLAAGSNVTITPSGQTLTLAATAGPGGVLPTGTAGQTLRHNGTAWVPNSALMSDGTDVTITGTLAFPTAVRVTQAGNLFLHGSPSGSVNVFLGASAGNPVQTGGENSGVGYGALGQNTSGGANSALGYYALGFNTTGSNNTGAGVFALESNGTGNANTAAGSEALRFNTSGDFNSAVGYQALASNTSGGSNTAVGYQALTLNTVGGSNTGVGYKALYDNTFGAGNAAIGAATLLGNTEGHHNTAAGTNALTGNTTGNYNTAIGHDALRNNVSGLLNIAIGDGAGTAISSGNSNIDIGNAGFANESNTIRIGDPSFQFGTIIAGIAGATAPSGSAVLISGGGRLGTMTSSRRFKEAIRDVAAESDGLMRLRPVVFRYKRELDPAGFTQYGLIAEEVAEIYPELVVNGRDGQPETIRYHLIDTLLLSEVQKQRRTIEAQQKTIEELSSRLAKLEARFAERPEAVGVDGK